MSLTKSLALLSAVSIYVLIVIGGYVSATESGLACPDWPLCNGKIIPDLSPPVLAEYTHRLWTVVVSLLVVLTAVVVWRSPIADSAARYAAGFTIVLLFSQILLGMVAVASTLQPHIVTSHLGLATALFGTSLYVLFRVSVVPA